MFWANPPWANADGTYQMGLAPVAASQWCSKPISSSELTAKLELLATHGFDVARAIPGSEPAQQLVLNAVEAHHKSTAAENALHRLNIEADEPFAASALITKAALCVPEDLCVLERSGDHYKLVAACVAAPSYWRLSDKLGKSLWAVHDNVPGLNAALGERMQALFERLPEQHSLMRRNWLIHGSSERFQPKQEQLKPIVTASAARQLVVRSETQTLRRLSDDVIVFTIAVECHPLREILAYPDAARTLLAALKSRNEAERQAASQASYEQGVSKLLERCAAE